MLLCASLWLTSREDNEVVNFIENKYSLSRLRQYQPYLPTINKLPRLSVFLQYHVIN